MKRNVRNTWRYKAWSFLYRLTWDDVTRMVKMVKFYIMEILTAIVIFLFLFFFPAFFH